MRRRFQNKGSKQERDMVRTLDNLRLYDQLMPAIKATALAGGGADAILKKSEVLAVLKIIELIDAEKPDVALKAAIEVANRSLGKPVERTLSLYGDIAKMNERDLDNQILKAIESAGAQPLIEAAVTERKLPAPKVRQPRKPRKSNLISENLSNEKPKTEI